MAKTDTKTLQLIEQVKAQRAEITKLQKPSYNTNLSFSYQEGVRSSAINLHVERDVRKLISIAGFLVERQNAYLEGARLLGLKEFPEFTWDGHSLRDWLQDLKVRIGVVQIAEKKTKLAALEARLKKIISPELQAELELADIEKELGK